MKRKIVMILCVVMCIGILGGCGSQKPMSNAVLDKNGQVSTEEVSANEAGVVSYQNLSNVQVFANGNDLITLTDLTNTYADLSLYDSYFTQTTTYEFCPAGIISTDMQGALNMIYGDEIYSTSFDSIESLSVLYHDSIAAKNISGNFVLSVYFSDTNEMNKKMGTEQIVLTADTGEDVIESVNCKYNAADGSVKITSSKKDMTLNIGIYVIAEDGNSGMFFKEVQLADGEVVVFMKDIVADYTAELSGEKIDDTVNQVDTQLTVN